MTSPPPAREWWITQRSNGSAFVGVDSGGGEVILVIEHSAFEQMRTDLSVKLQRTVNAAESALFEMSAWMGIPEKKRATRVKELMENVQFCAEHDLRQHDESQALNQMRRERDELQRRVTELSQLLRDKGIR